MQILVYLLWLFFYESCRAETLLKYIRHYNDYIDENRTSLSPSFLAQ